VPVHVLIFCVIKLTLYSVESGYQVCGETCCLQGGRGSSWESGRLYWKGGVVGMVSRKTGMGNQNQGRGKGDGVLDRTMGSLGPEGQEEVTRKGRISQELCRPFHSYPFRAFSFGVNKGKVISVTQHRGP
jgi:hypothetical protein